MPPPTAPMSAPRLRLLLLPIAPTAAPPTAPMIAPFWASVMGRRLPYSSVAQPLVNAAKAATVAKIDNRFISGYLQDLIDDRYSITIALPPRPHPAGCGKSPARRHKVPPFPAPRQFPSHAPVSRHPHVRRARGHVQLDREQYRARRLPRARRIPA